MERDQLTAVLVASSRKTIIEPESGRRLVTLISFRTLGLADRDLVRRCLRTIAEKLRVTPVVVGGGYGCTKVIVKIVELESDDPREIERITKELLYGSTVRDEATKASFAVLTTSDPYERRDLRTGAIDGCSCPVTIFTNEVNMSNKSGDSYHFEKAGIVGPNAKIEKCTQIWNEWNADASAPDLTKLAAELGTLRLELKAQAKTPEEDADVGVVAQAEVAAKKGNGSKAIEMLSGAGKWVLSVAEKISVAVAAEAIKKSAGL